jgi:hypothetical protein
VLKSIDILIGVSVVMLVVSMLVTVLTHIFTTLSNTRGRHWSKSSMLPENR